MNRLAEELFDLSNTVASLQEMAAEYTEPVAEVEQFTTQNEFATAGRQECLVTARELAEILGVHENYIYERAAHGVIPSFKIGGHRRFRWSEVEEWLASCRDGPAGESGKGVKYGSY